MVFLLLVVLLINGVAFSYGLKSNLSAMIPILCVTATVSIGTTIGAIYVLEKE